jgi:hypothetical protein
MTDTRPCTCAPDERPYPCQHKYALGECRKQYIRVLRSQVTDLEKDREELFAVGRMLDAVVEGAQESFVKTPYGASHEDVAQINDWHAMAKEARSEFAGVRAAVIDKARKQP